MTIGLGSRPSQVPISVPADKTAQVFLTNQSQIRLQVAIQSRGTAVTENKWIWP